MPAYYNEFNPIAASALRQLIKDGIIADGEVDTRSITEVTPNDVKGYTQCHFFAGIGGWSIALRRRGWDDNRPVWTGSCPCQPFSTAGSKKGKQDARHLWPIWFNIIKECRPTIVFGEQVEKAISYGWLDEVATHLENKEYAVAATILGADAVEGDHERRRLWFVAQSPQYDDTRESGKFQEAHERKASEGQKERLSEFSGSSGTKFVALDDGYRRRIPDIQPQICLLADALPRQRDIEHLIGNAIDIDVAARFIGACI